MEKLFVAFFVAGVLLGGCGGLPIPNETDVAEPTTTMAPTPTIQPTMAAHWVSEESGQVLDLHADGTAVSVAFVENPDTGHRNVIDGTWTFDGQLLHIDEGAISNTRVLSLSATEVIFDSGSGQYLSHPYMNTNAFPGVWTQTYQGCGGSITHTEIMTFNRDGSFNDHFEETQNGTTQVWDYPGTWNADNLAVSTHTSFRDFTEDYLLLPSLQPGASQLTIGTTAFVR